MAKSSEAEPCALSGKALLCNSYYNKGSAFPLEEREIFDLTGLLLPNVQTLEEQAERAYEQYNSKRSDLDKNIFLASLKEQNVTLYYSLVLSHLDEMFSIIYTPTESEAIKKYHHLFRRPEGCFITIDNRDENQIEKILRQAGQDKDIQYLVVTDGEQILGIGDQGVNGILISVAKLVLVTLLAGVHPCHTLPVVLDCGTNNQAMLKDDLYLGLRKKRAPKKEYDEFVDTFLRKCRDVFPNAYVHLEDFGVDNARRLLERWSDRIPCFNDDIQGTGCVVLAAVLSALTIQQTKLKDLRVVIFGAGSAGCGIADQLTSAIASESDVSKEDAASHIWLIDKEGLLTTDSLDVTQAQWPYLKDGTQYDGPDLKGVVKQVRPHCLIGTSGQAGAFDSEVLAAMGDVTERPIIFPLSNPNSLHEAKPEDILEATLGKALVATGSPFGRVRGAWGDGGREIEMNISECNNSVVFPGIGLGSILCGAEKVTNGMLMEAVKAVISTSPAVQTGDASQGLLPGVVKGREVSLKVARNVMLKAVEEEVATAVSTIPPEDELEEWIKSKMWDPIYKPLKRAGGS